MKKYYNFFDKDISKFVSRELREKEIENFKSEMTKVQQNKSFCEIKIFTLSNIRQEDLEVIDAFKKKQKRLERPKFLFG